MGIRNKIFRLKRRLKEEWKGIKYIFSSEEGQQILRTSYIIYETSRVIYNPFRLLDIFVFRKLLKS